MLGGVLADLRLLPIPKKWIKESVSNFQGGTVNNEYCLQVIRNLREAIRQKRPDLWKNKNWLLHHDNAPAHTSFLVRKFLAQNNTITLPQPAYSPDLAPCDVFLFPKLKRTMKGRRYATIEEIKTPSKEELNKITKNDFLKCFEDWKNVGTSAWYLTRITLKGTKSVFMNKEIIFEKNTIRGTFQTDRVWCERKKAIVFLPFTEAASSKGQKMTNQIRHVPETVTNIEYQYFQQ